MKKFYLFLLICFLSLSGFLFLPNTAKAEEVIISNDTVWDSGDVKVFHDDDSLSIYNDVTLTITNGTILKMGKNATIFVGGKLVVNGSSEKPVIITSIKDDSVGGDSDGVSAQPAPGDWYAIISGPGSEVDINYAIVEYGGMRLDDIETGVITAHPLTSHFYINHSSIINNSGWNIIGTPDFKINNSNIYNPDFCRDMDGVNFCGTAIVNYSAGIFDLTNNYWGHAGGPTTGADLKGTFIGGSANFEPYASEPIELFKKGINPVILIPGILGSWKVSGEWKIDPILGTYNNLMEAFISAGYREQTIFQLHPNLFTLPYDWRVDNNITAGKLKDKIQEVKNITGSQKVDLVAHSMGGLVARAYIQSDDYNNDVDQLIFLGTPHLGSPESYPRWEAAYFGGKPIDFLFRTIFTTEAISKGYFNLTDYIRAKVPTVGQLLSVSDYLKDKDANSNWILRQYPNNYPQNQFLENLNSVENISKLKQRVKVSNIIGDIYSSTLNYIKVVSDPNLKDNLWQNGYPENLNKNEDAFELGSGDGTVPYASANYLNNVETIETKDKHMDLPTTRQQDVIEILTGKRPENYFDSEIAYNITRWTILRVYSPVDFIVIAPDGKKVGKDFINNTSTNEIENAFYTGFSDDIEFVMIPNPQSGEYRVQLQGVDGGGEYKFVTSFIDENNPSINSEVEVKSNIANNTIDEFTVDYVKDNPNTTIESEVDFEKLISLTKILYNSKEIKQKKVYDYLISNFKFLQDKTEKLSGHKNKKLTKVLAKFVELRLRLMIKELDLYLKKNWISSKANLIIKSNINLLIDKL